MNEPTNQQTNKPTNQQTNEPTNSRGSPGALILVLILILGATLRLTGVDWDQGQHLHPDERFLTMVETALSLPGARNVAGPPPQGCTKWGGYFDTRCSPLSPYNHNFGFFVYGTFPIFLTRLVGEWLEQTGYEQIALVGRVLSALFDLTTVLLIFFIGRRMYGTRVGLVGAFFLALSALDIQQSHFFTVDTFTNVPILLAFWFALDVADGRGIRAFVLAGAMFGLALAGRINIAPFAVVLIAAAVLYAYRAAGATADHRPPTDDHRPPTADHDQSSAISEQSSVTSEQSSVISDQPSVANDQPSAISHQPSAIGDQPSVISDEPAAVGGLSSAVVSQPSVISDEPAAVGGLPSAVSSQPSVISDEPAAVGGLSSAVVSQPSTISHQPLVAEVQPSVITRHPSPVTRHATLAFGGLVIAALVTLIAFRIFQPYAANGPNFLSPRVAMPDLSRGSVMALLDVALFWAGGVNPTFADNMNQINGFISGQVDYPPNHQWTARPAYIFPFENIVLWGLGLPLGLAAWAGFAFALYQLVCKRKWEHLLIVLWVGVTFLYMGQQFAKTIRYFLPLYPFLALLAAYLIVSLWRYATRNHALSVVEWTQYATRNTQYAILLRAVAALLALIVIGYTLFWGVAFTTIYTRPVSRVTASRWMFENIPQGASIANEHWDDPLPLRVDGKDPFGGMYHGVEMQWYGEDTPEKRTLAIGWIDQADYIVLSSNRLYGSIPRLPMRYPMTTKYYEWLFDGTLGFDLIGTFTSRPQLFGIEINDDDAEESFTVYDHPKALIFKKTPRYSLANTTALFNSVDLFEVYRFMPRDATQAPTALLLKPADWDAQLAGGTWSQIFNPNDLINRVPVLGWLAMIEILGWLAFPIAFVVFRALADRGYIFAKALGVLLPAWGAWLLASYHALPFSRMSIVLVIMLIALASAFAVWRRGREMRAFVREQRAIVLVEEILFLIFFAMFLAIRFGNPDLWHPNFGGEKPMDFAYLNAIIKSTWFPPYDPWFAGGYINYYYFGQLITATLIRLSGIVPEVAYNLALPMYFALTAMGAFSVVFNLVRNSKFKIQNSKLEMQNSKSAPSISNFDPSTTLRARLRITNYEFAAPLLAALLVAVIGNLGQLVLIGQTFVRIGGGDAQGSPLSILGSVAAGFWRVLIDRQPFDVRTGDWYWNATRVIPETINEFPFFSFLYADLHAHLMALPFALLLMGVAVNFIMRERGDSARLPFISRVPISPIDVLEVLVAALALCALRAINFADFATYLPLIACALAIGEYARRQRIDWAGVSTVTWQLIAIVILSSVLYQPFVSNFATAYLATELWKGMRTTVPEYLLVHGIVLFPIATFLFLRTFHTGQSRKLLLDWMPLIVTLLVVIEALLIFANVAAFAIAFPLLMLAAWLILRPDLDAPQRLIALLIAAALAMTMMVELITYKGDIGRMNTVFKFYLQVWVFLGVAAAASIAMLQTADGEQSSSSTQHAIRNTSLVTRPPSLPSWWWMVFAALLFVGFLYPVTAAKAKVSDRFVPESPAGLNGMDYMRAAVYHDQNRALPLEFDRQAIEWLRENMQGSPVILEGNSPLYHWGSRVSIYTGLPTVIGWDWHQKQQRSIVDGAIIDHRIETVRNIYNTRDVSVANTNLQRFRVSYIYVGDMERAFYDPQGLAKFDTMAKAGQLEVVYENERVKIYKIKG